MKNKPILFILLIMLMLSNSFAAEKKPFSFEDVMTFKNLKNQRISNDGKWILYIADQERGNSELIVQNTVLDTMKYTSERASRAVFSENSGWVAAYLQPDAIKLANAKKDKPKQGMVLINLVGGKKHEFEDVSNFKFSNDSRWLAYKSFKDNTSGGDKKSKRVSGTDLTLRHLITGAELVFQNVSEYEFDSLSTYFVFAVSEPEGKKNGLYYIDLKGSFTMPLEIHAAKNMYYSELSWYEKDSKLAFIAAKAGKNDKPDSCTLNIWDPMDKEVKEAVSFDEYPEGWYISFKNRLKWTEDGKAVYFGFKSYSDTTSEDEEISFNDTTYYDPETILKEKELDIWHWNDPRIKPHEKIWWNSYQNETYAAIYRTDTDNFFQLADFDLPSVFYSDNSMYTWGFNESPYLKEITWNGWFQDLYLIDLRTGEKKLLAERLEEAPSLSPSGKYLAYFTDDNWYLYNCTTDTTEHLNAVIETPFYDEDHDTPSDPPSYGVAGWLENDAAVYIYDKYDIWAFYTNDGGFINQTVLDGRTLGITFRIRDLKKDRKYFSAMEQVFMLGFHEKSKKTALYRLKFDIYGAELIEEENCKFSLIQQSKDSKRILFTKERYDLFPDLWVTDSIFNIPKKLTNYNSQLEEYRWGTTELIDWVSDDPSADTLQGFIIQPENFDPEKRYPVVVYFYEKMSQRMYNFERPGNHHRPCFAVYNSDDYVIFLPDINFREGYPGMSAVNSIVPGVKKLIELGIADSNRLGIWGHSWSGYQAAYLISQTDIFEAAVAGAPVGNMTSAYSGIRLGTGLARQFQYEKYQSRIGGNLWDSLDNYIDNSPIFMAQTIKTPLLIMFGDVDQAVPWEQGIELYLAMRRLNKNCVFLQYRGEPHWPEKYPNQLDYAMKMKQFFDYYVKDEKPAPDWIIKGIRYMGK